MGKWGSGGGGGGGYVRASVFSNFLTSKRAFSSNNLPRRSTALLE